MNANERNEMVKPEELNIMPEAVQTEVKVTDENPIEETKPEVVENIGELTDLAMGVDDEEENEDAETEYDFSTLNKLQLIEILEETVQDTDVVKIKDKVASIKFNFLKICKEERDQEMEQFILDGGDKENYEHVEDPLEARFRAAFNIFRENKAKYIDALEEQKVANLQQKNAILEELKQLISSEETLKKTYDEFRALQDKWKEIGQVPAAEITNLWNNYHFLIEKFYDKVKINRELRDLDLKKNLEAKIEICEKTEELLLEKSVTKAFKLLQKYHDEWKEIGPVPQEKKDEIWERFKNTTDKINQVRREHYSKIQDEQQANLDAKVAICEKIEELLNDSINSIGAWQKKSNEVNELFKLWKSVGPAQKKQNDEIWNRFKASMDAFFSNKKEFFSRLKEQQIDNYNRKLQLCIEAEALAESKEWKKATDQIKKLQEEWKKIGPVPKRHSDKIWKRFRSACDTFFTSKSEHFSGVKGVEEENLRLKRELLERIKAYEIQKERSANMEAIRGFQREWMAIGFVPMKYKDSLQEDYRNSIDALFDKMKNNENEISTAEYRTMVEGLKDNPESRDKVRRERNILTNKITKLREEIVVLENNIGFFTGSKQSELMRAEYEKKINRSKNEIKVLEAKLKILNEQ
ncbi:MAG: DUF349 domain-containing protein [Bacteroidales bacterium]|nr:DUF349 domain-containing protein [Bacteroidales bacterium]